MPRPNNADGDRSPRRHPSQDHSATGDAPAERSKPRHTSSPAHSTFTPNNTLQDSIDPDLEENLGAELPLRGDQLEDAVEQARAEAEQWRDKAMRAQADFENTRKRLEARHADEVRRAGERIISDLLPVMDDLERAADHVAEVAPEMAEGILAVQRKLLATMHKEGVAQIDPLGEAFDPTFHQAVQTQEDPELPDHSVCAVYQKGYEMHGRVLRPAMVVVCTGGPARE